MCNKIVTILFKIGPQTWQLSVQFESSAKRLKNKSTLVIKTKSLFKVYDWLGAAFFHHHHHHHHRRRRRHRCHRHHFICHSK